MDILWGESKQKANISFVLEHTVSMCICNVKMQKLTPKMEFVSLCLHHYKDMNSIYLLSQGSLNLNLFCDIYFYFKNNQPDIPKLQLLCDKLSTTEYVYYCLCYAICIFEEESLEQVLSSLKTQKSEALLATFGLINSEIKEWKIRFLERLFTNNINEYFHTHLTAEDFQKIKLNSSLM